MFLLLKSMMSFPLVFWAGVNPYTKTKTASTNFDEAASAYGKEKKRGKTQPTKK